MKQKYKATPLARFLLFMIIFTPLAYLGASYYKGEDGLANIKKVLNLEPSKTKKISSIKEEIQLHKDEIKRLEKQLEQLEN